MTDGRSHTRARRLLTAAAIGLLVGIGYPMFDLWRHCRVPHSEECVWGRALLPLSLGVGTVVALVIAAVAYSLLRTRARRQDSEPPAR